MAKQPKADESRYLTEAEVAGQFSCDVRTVRAWVARGALRALRLPSRSGRGGRAVRILRADVEALHAQMERGA
jgi:excisionase family DNA binding protein